MRHPLARCISFTVAPALPMRAPPTRLLTSSLSTLGGGTSSKTGGGSATGATGPAARLSRSSGGTGEIEIAGTGAGAISSSMSVENAATLPS